MRSTRWMSVALCLTVFATNSATAQGKGGSNKDKADKADKAARTHNVKAHDKVVKGAAKAVRKEAGKEVREIGGEVFRSDVRSLVSSGKHGRRLVGRAISKANKRGASDADFVVMPAGQRVLIRNRRGDLLVDVDDDRDLGVWRVVTARETRKSGSPSFCRSGAGHPVWGRQWCVDKGFGLGLDQDLRWGRAIGVDNVVFRRDVTDSHLGRAVLLDVLGDVVFNRLAAHAITLGFVEPLSGRWIGQPSGGPRVLLLSSGPRPVAEVVDVNRDGRADLLLVATKP